MHFFSSYGAWLARSTLTLAKARQLAGAGLQAVILQVDWQRSRLAQRTATTLLAEHSAALAAGLEVWWWAWCTPTRAPDASRCELFARAERPGWACVGDQLPEPSRVRVRGI